MKTKIFLLLAMIISLSFTKQDGHNSSWKATKHMIINDYGANNYTTEAIICYNSGALAFYTPESGFQSFNMEERSRKVVKGVQEVCFISPDNYWMVTLRIPNEIEIQRMKGFSEAYIFKGLKLYNSDMKTFINVYQSKK